MASGTIDADGKMHLTSTWYNGGVIFHADYNGTLTPSGGTFMGTQTWHSPVVATAPAPVQPRSCSSQRPISRRHNNQGPINRRPINRGRINRRPSSRVRTFHAATIRKAATMGGLPIYCAIANVR